MQATAAIDELTSVQRDALRMAMIALSGGGEVPASVGLGAFKLRSLIGSILNGERHPEVIGELTGLLRRTDWHAAEALLERSEERGVRVLTPYDLDYPVRFRQLPDPPLTLFLRGVAPWTASPLGAAAASGEQPDEDVIEEQLGVERRCFVSVVGARGASHYGISVARSFARELSSNGVIVVSGFARGCDSAAHEGALAAAQSSKRACHPGAAVLGSGLSRIYPRENGALAEEFLEYGGCIISEYGLDAAPQKHFFPERNRLISALSDLVVVIEAKEQSGALITARSALEQGKEVCAVPGPIVSELSRGSNRLIAEGARILCDVEDLRRAVTEVARVTFPASVSGPDIRRRATPPRRSAEAASPRAPSAGAGPRETECGAAVSRAEGANGTDGAGARPLSAEPVYRGPRIRPVTADDFATPYEVLVRICCVFEPGQIYSIDRLVALTQLPVHTLMTGLSELALYGGIHEITASAYSWDRMVDTPEIFEQIRRPDSNPGRNSV